MFVAFFVCGVGSSHCDELVTRSDESTRCVCLIKCDVETSNTRWLRHDLGPGTTEIKSNFLTTLLEDLILY
jgi:hypothetical protein